MVTIFCIYKLDVSHLVSAYELDPVLVDDSDDAWGVKPCLSVDLDRDPLAPQNADDDGPALRDPVALKVHYPRRPHVHRPEHGHNLCTQKERESKVRVFKNSKNSS